MTINRVLVANRGEIALRVIRACQGLGIQTVLAASEADLDSLPARVADRTVCIGPARSTDSYLNVAAIITAATGTGADAVHPGYGFLSESPALAEACRDAGVVFVGPTPEQMTTMGNKIEARRRAAAAGVAMLAGTDRVADATQAVELADRVGYPVMMKAAAGGGGRGMKIVTDPAALPAAFQAASAEALAAFGEATLYFERYLTDARHVEVQVLGDHHGAVVHLGERDCSLQRRHQKLVEEAPAPGLPEQLRTEIRAAAVALAAAIGYHGAGTVEFLVDPHAGVFSFLEMNTRIQVEHPVTEMITGIDLVQAQLRIASGEPLWFTQDEVTIRGHAIECRINAESPEHDFRPNAGRITCFDPPTGPFVRLDTHCHTGYQIPIHYDSMLAKLITHAPTRTEAQHLMQHSLQHFRIDGIATNIAFQHHAITSTPFTQGRVSTQLVDDELLPAYERIVRSANTE